MEIDIQHIKKWFEKNSAFMDFSVDPSNSEFRTYAILNQSDFNASHSLMAEFGSLFLPHNHPSFIVQRKFHNYSYKGKYRIRPFAISAGIIDGEMKSFKPYYQVDHFPREEIDFFSKNECHKLAMSTIKNLNYRFIDETTRIEQWLSLQYQIGYNYSLTELETVKLYLEPSSYIFSTEMIENLFIDVKRLSSSKNSSVNSNIVSFIGLLQEIRNLQDVELSIFSAMANNKIGAYRIYFDNRGDYKSANYICETILELMVSHRYIQPDYADKLRAHVNSQIELGQYPQNYALTFTEVPRVTICFRNKDNFNFFD